MADLRASGGGGAEVAIGYPSLIASPFDVVFELPAAAEGDGGNVANDSSGSSRALFAAGGDIGGERMGSGCVSAILGLRCRY